MKIVNNIPALSAFNTLSRSNSPFQKTLQQLSSGLRINSAADDAAGLAISEKMRSQISGLDMARKNTQDGISLLQTAEGGLEATTSILQRMRELSVQAANDVLTQQDRSYIQTEIEQLKQEVDRVSKTTQFNKKKLLDGSAGALWSSSDNAVKAKIHGGLTGIDEFGQKINPEGNYELEIRADPGKAQVQKSNVFTVREIEGSSFRSYKEININTGVDEKGFSSGNGWTFRNNTLFITGNGTYGIVGELDENGQTIATSNYVRVEPGVEATIYIRDVNIEAEEYAFYMEDASVDMYIDPGKYNNVNRFIGGSSFHCSALECGYGSSLTINSISGKYSTDGMIYAQGSTHSAAIGGACSGAGNGRQTAGKITIWGGTIQAQGGELGSGIGGAWYGGAEEINIYGGKIIATGGAGGGAGIGSGIYTNNNMSTLINIYGGDITAIGVDGAAGIGGGIGSDSGVIKISSSANITASGYIDTSSTNVSICCGLGGTTTDVSDIQWSPDEYNLVNGQYTLRDIKQFYSEDGIFLVEDPQKMTITQGNGKSAQFMIYANDTLESLAERINDTIAYGLGQKKYTDDVEHFASYVDNLVENTSESVKSTILVRSVVAGKGGELVFSGNEELLNALGLNTIQSSTESEFNIAIRNAHSGETLSFGTKITGNILHGAIHPNVDIEFDTMANIKANWDEKNKRYCLSSGPQVENNDGIFSPYDNGEPYKAVIHLADNTLMLQTGANEGEDFIVRIGDMSANSLGVNRVNVMSHDMASRSITIIDEALDKVLTQRASIGANINSLEHTMNNLITSHENLTHSESRIRDTDMAKAMMIFTQLNIMRQANISMLAQANQFPQQVLSLIR